MCKKMLSTYYDFEGGKGDTLTDWVMRNCLISFIVIGEGRTSRVKTTAMKSSAAWCQCLRVKRMSKRFFWGGEEKLLIICCNVNGLIKCLNWNQNPTEWRLWVNFSKISMKAVLLHSKRKTQKAVFLIF